MVDKPRPICPKCHLPVKEDESWITHQGKTYHRLCAPEPEVAGKKDEVFSGRPFHNM
ncbi:MAG: hypothetical protein ACRD1Y_00120 [Terriglobales bacterium]